MILADLLEFAVLHFDGSMVLDLLPDVPVSSDCGILSSEVLTLLHEFKINNDNHKSLQH